MGGIFCIYISIAEFVELHDRRVDNQRKVQEEIVKIGCKSDNSWEKTFPGRIRNERRNPITF